MPIKKIRTVFEAKDSSGSTLSRLGTKFDKLKGRIDKVRNSRFTQLARRISGIGLVVGALGSAVGGVSFAQLASGGLEAGDNIAKTSAKLGIATEELTKLQFAVSQNTTVAIPQFNTALQRMVRRIGGADGVADSFTKKLDTFGLSVAELKKLAPEEQFRLIAERMAELDDQGTRVALAFSIFDTEGANLVNLLQQGSGAIDDFSEKAESLGFGFDISELNKIEAANDAISRAQDSVKFLGIAFATEFAPAIEGLANGLVEYINQAGGVQEISERIFESARNGIARVRSIAQTLSPIFRLLIEILKPIVAVLKVVVQALAVVARGVLRVINFFKRSKDEALSATQELEKFNRVASTLGQEELDSTSVTSIETLQAQRSEKERNLEVLQSELQTLRSQREELGAIDRLRFLGKIGDKEDEIQKNKDLVSSIDSLIIKREEDIKAQEKQSELEFPKITNIDTPEISDVDLGSDISPTASSVDVAKNARERLATIAASQSQELQIRKEFADRVKELNTLTAQAGNSDIDRSAILENFAKERDEKLNQLEIQKQDRVSALRSEFDEEFRIRNEFNKRLESLENLEKEGIVLFDRDQIVAQYEERLALELSELEKNKLEKIEKERQDLIATQQARLETQRLLSLEQTNDAIDSGLNGPAANGNEFSQTSLDSSLRLDELSSQLEARNEVLRTARLEERITEEEHLAALADGRLRYEGQVSAIQEFAAEQQQANAKNAFIQGLSQLSQHSKSAFNLLKVARLSEAIISGKQAVIDAFRAGMSTGGPFAPKLAALYAGAAALKVGAQIREIASSKFGSKSSAGSNSVTSSGTTAPANAATTFNNDLSENANGVQNVVNAEVVLGRRSGSVPIEDVDAMIDAINIRVGDGVNLRATYSEQSDVANSVA